MIRRNSKKRTTAEDLRGPSVLRSGLVSTQDDDDRRCQTNPSADLLKDLEICGVLGKGGYGLVHKVKQLSTGQFRVLKTVERPYRWDNEQLKMEAELLQNLDHPHVLRIFAWCKEGDTMQILMEFCSGGKLVEAVTKGRRLDQQVPESWVVTAIRQALEALVYIHGKGIVHKDIKSGNLLLLQSTESKGRVFWHKPHVTVCDLGLAEICSRGIFGTSIGGGRACKVAGTPVSMAPEVWKGNFGPKSDIWSLGVVLFQLLSMKDPFRPACNDESHWEAAHRKGPTWEEMQSSNEAMRFCKSLLTVKEAQRPTAAQCLEHRWISQSLSQRVPQEELDAFAGSVRSWRNMNPMQRALSVKMAATCSSLKKFATLFSQFDSDKSGILDSSEILPALGRLGFEQAMAKEIASALDINNDGSCEYVEFAAAFLTSLEHEFDDLLCQEFNRLDSRGRGWLTGAQMSALIEELRPLAVKHGFKLQDLDSNGDGVISFKEFCEYFGRPGTTYKRYDESEDELEFARSRSQPKPKPKRQVEKEFRSYESEPLSVFQTAGMQDCVSDTSPSKRKPKHGRRRSATLKSKADAIESLFVRMMVASQGALPVKDDIEVELPREETGSLQAAIKADDSISRIFCSDDLDLSLERMRSHSRTRSRSQHNSDFKAACSGCWLASVAHRWLTVA